MQFIESYLKNQENHILLAEDIHGLFVLLRRDQKSVDREIQKFCRNPHIKWFRDFSHQRPGDSERGAREAVVDFFRGLKERNLDLPAGLSYLRNEV